MGKLLQAILDFAYPRMCPLCGRTSDRDGRFICWNCMSMLDICSAETTCCTLCGKIPDGEVKSPFTCPVCAEHKPAFDFARSALSYGGDTRGLIHDFKYNRHIWYQRDLGDILEACARSCFDCREIDCVIPVPLHAAKFIRRSYNQSAMLASELGGRLGIPCGREILKRLRDTPTQTHLGIEGRRKNVSGVFSVSDPGLVTARTILVVDDVMTTGATLDEIAATLKKSGAWRVYGLTLARAPMGR